MKRRHTWLVLLLTLLAATGIAQDTTVVQTLIFDSITTRRGIWNFPEGKSFRKILMVHTLKCDPRTTHDKYDCGEWDYLTYNTVYFHTGMYDSTLYHQPSFTFINDQSSDSLMERNDPTYTYYRKLHQFPAYPDTLSLSNFWLGAGSNASDAVFNTQHNDGRSQFLWRAEELTAAGLSEGEITGLKLHVNDGGTNLRHLVIRMQQIEEDTLTTWMLVEDLEQVFHANGLVEDTGWLSLPFYRPFTWDGSSNLLVDLAWEQPEPGTAASLSCDDPGFDCGITAYGPGMALDFDGEMDFVLADSDVYFHGNCTFETWFYKRSNNQWSRVFDFGNGPNKSNFIVTLSNNESGKLSVHVNNLNGISKSIVTPDPIPLHKWTHVAVTMTMERLAWVYIDGDSLMINVLQDPDSVVREINYIGRSNWSSDQYSDVIIDDLRISHGTKTWPELRYRRLHSLNDPQNDPNLYLYYDFNEGAGTDIQDKSSRANHGKAYGLPAWSRIHGPALHMDFLQNNDRPQIRFERLETTQLLIDSVYVTDSTENSMVQLVLFDDPDNPPEPTDTILVYQAGYTYVYQDHEIVDSVWNDYTTIRRKEMIPWYGEPFEILEPYEIGRYITPYGINLSLGPNGFSWIYDVTDYAPLLQGEVELSAGNQQELIDLKFLMIHGTPPRDVIKMDRIWGPRKSYKYKDLAGDVVLSDTTFQLEPGASQFKVRARLTGHGHNSNTGNYPHCCEWKDNTHYLLADGQEVSQWHIFQYHDCALNPVYPQGGTWPGAREGWCPGDRVMVHDVELPDAVPGSNITLDYDITPVPTSNLGMGEGNYVVDMMLFQYGAPNFDHDIEVYDVIMPTTYEYHARKNPTCTDPTIVVRNNGASAVTTLEVSYGVSGGEPQTYSWEGNLLPNLMDTIVLPVPGGYFWFGDTLHRFEVCVSDPNGMTDQYPDNDCYHTSFEIPDMYDEPMVLQLRTNKQAYRYTLEVRDIMGGIALSRSNLANDSIYNDTLNLANGCYTITLLDEEDMGLSYWAYPAQGSGSFKIYDTDGNLLKFFNPEFGRLIKYGFLMGDISYVAEPNKESSLLVYPNPASDHIYVRFEDPLSGNDPKQTFEIRVVDIRGNTMKLEEHLMGSGVPVKIETHSWAPGLYLVVVSNRYHTQTQKIVVQ